MRIGVSVNEFLDEFPSITRDQALEVYDLVEKKFTLDQIKSLAAGPGVPMSYSRVSASR